MQENICGLYAGQVVSVKDPEHRGRIKVKIAELLGEATSSWCEPCVPCCFEGGGDFCLPDLKDYVWVSFVAGDLDRPVYFGGWWTADSSPLGEKYEKPTTKRIINFGDMNIKFDTKDNSISLKTSEGEDSCELKITPKKVTINGKAIS